MTLRLSGTKWGPTMKLRPEQIERGKIDSRDAAAVKHWSKHFSVTPDELQRAIAKVGNAADDIRKELARLAAVAQDSKAAQ